MFNHRVFKFNVIQVEILITWEARHDGFKPLFYLWIDVLLPNDPLFGLVILGNCNEPPDVFILLLPGKLPLDLRPLGAEFLFLGIVCEKRVKIFKKHENGTSKRDV